jgi:tetratricopeptide (TPR) repeat protein
MFVKGNFYNLRTNQTTETGMKKLIQLLAAFFLFSLSIRAQQVVAIDTMKAQLSRAKSDEAKIYILGNLIKILMNVNIAQADSFGARMIEIAENSRDRSLMVKAYIANGFRYSFLAGRKDFLNKSISYYNQALNVARDNKLPEETGSCLLALAGITLYIPDANKSLSDVTEAFSIFSTLDNNDSLIAECHRTFGRVYLVKDEKLLALRNYLTGLRLAEKVDAPKLIRSCYQDLLQFYSAIGSYDRAIDYAMLAYKKLDDINEGNAPYQKAIDLTSIGNLFAAKKSFDMSINFYERSVKMADSLKFESLKIPAYIGILNQYLDMGQPQKAIDYVKGNTQLKEFLQNMGFSFVLSQIYAVAYRDMSKFDSAQYYFLKALPYFENQTSVPNRIDFYFQYAKLFKAMGNFKAAAGYYERSKGLADSMQSLEWIQKSSAQLDSTYVKLGDFKQAHFYNTLSSQYKDSLEKLGKEKDLIQEEATDEQRRLERIKKEEELKEERRHNIQYTGIIIGIAAFFVLLVLLGAFRVSESTIKVLGFFAFIMLFEFIILLLDTQIHTITHGEPWKVLGIKIVLIAILLPLHHWIEHKVVSYLTSHKMMMPSGRDWWRKKFGKTKEPVH